MFVEFSNAHGLKQKTRVSFRGVKVEYVKHLNIQLNTVVALLYINYSNTLIPKSSIIEANQVGLFSDIVIDITSLKLISYSKNTFNKCKI